MPNATGGYAVFRASEAKLRDIANLPVRNDSDLVARATDLRDLVMPLERSLDAFSRVNAKLIPPPEADRQVEYEVEVPGTLDGIVVFAVSSVTREQETSGLSSPWLFVAVPRRAVPGLPALSIAPHNGTAILTCDFAKAPKPARVEIFRVQHEFAAHDVDTMGLPIHESVEDAWQALDEKDNPAASSNQTHHFRFSFEDTTPPSWFPYFYRSVAVGGNDEANGFLPGRSQQSTLVKVENTPSTLPEIINIVGEQNGPQTVRLQFRSDAPVQATPHGSFRLEIIPWNFSQNRFDETMGMSIILSKATPHPADGILTPGNLYYSPAGADGKLTFQTLLNVNGESYLVKVRLIDPLNRSTQRIVNGKILETAAPHLTNLRINRASKDLLLFFESTTSIIKPPSGRYRLDISFIPQSGGGIHLLPEATSS